MHCQIDQWNRFIVIELGALNYIDPVKILHTLIHFYSIPGSSVAYDLLWLLVKWFISNPEYLDPSRQLRWPHVWLARLRVNSIGSQGHSSRLPLYRLTLKEERLATRGKGAKWNSLSNFKCLNDKQPPFSARRFMSGGYIRSVLIKDAKGMIVNSVL